MRKIKFALMVFALFIAELASALPVYKFVSPTLELINYSASEILLKARYTAEVEIEGKGPSVNLTSQTRYMSHSELTKTTEFMDDNPEFDSKSGVWIYLPNTPENLKKILAVFLQVSSTIGERRLAISVRGVPADTSLQSIGTISGRPAARVSNSPFPYIRFAAKADVDIVEASNMDENPEQTYRQSNESAARANKAMCDALLLAESTLNFLKEL